MRTVKKIPYSHQSITPADVVAVTKVLGGDWLTQGPSIASFEKRLADYCGARYAVAVCNGTAALHIACLALGVKKGKEVITTPITFLATPNAVLYCQGNPVFADIEKNSANINPEEIVNKVSSRTCGIIPVHMGGHPVNLKRIYAIAKSEKLFVLEDACHALGAEYQAGGEWRKVGDCSYSDATVFSFHPVKSMTTGEGGAITTNSKEIYERLLMLRSHGVVKAADKFVAKTKPGGWYYEMQILGFNYRITDMQCALGSSQLRRLDFFMKKRREIAAYYDKRFERCEFLEPLRGSRNARSSYHLYVIRLKSNKLSQTRSQIFDRLQEAGIGTQVHYIPVHLQPYYQKLGYRAGEFPIAEKYYENAVSIPIYPGLTASERQKVADTVLKIVYSATK